MNNIDTLIDTKLLNYNDTKKRELVAEQQKQKALAEQEELEEQEALVELDNWNIQAAPTTSSMNMELEETDYSNNNYSNNTISTKKTTVYTHDNSPQPFNRPNKMY